MTVRFEGALARTSADSWTRTASKACKPSSEEARKLRAKAEHYRVLARSFFDLRVIAAVESCARELEAKADLIDANASRKPRWVLYQGRY
jgi:hypothetical protein